MEESKRKEEEKFRAEIKTFPEAETSGSIRYLRIGSPLYEDD